VHSNVASPFTNKNNSCCTIVHKHSRTPHCVWQNAGLKMFFRFRVGAYERYSKCNLKFRVHGLLQGGQEEGLFGEHLFLPSKIQLANYSRTRRRERLFAQVLWDSLMDSISALLVKCGRKRRGGESEKVAETIKSVCHANM